MIKKLLILLLLFSGCEDELTELDMIQDITEADNVFIDVRDNESYNLIKINGLLWFGKNLQFRMKYNSYVHNNNIENLDIFGRLYEWDSLICPEGSHMPDTIEWNGLRAYVNGDSRKLRDNDYWLCDGGTNTTGFTAMPGSMMIDKKFYDLGDVAYFWSSTLKDGLYPYFYSVACVNNDIFSNPVKKSLGMSVRCIKD